MLIGVRGFAHSHLDGRDAERPDVRLRVVLILADDLRRHPEGRAHKRAALGHGCGYLARNAEIGELDGKRAKGCGGAKAELDAIAWQR